MILGAGRMRISLEDVRVFAGDTCVGSGVKRDVQSWAGSGAPCASGMQACAHLPTAAPRCSPNNPPCSQAFVTCVEVTESTEGRGRIAATNVFEKQEGKWKMVLHHGGPAPR